MYGIKPVTRYVIVRYIALTRTRYTVHKSFSRIGVVFGARYALQFPVQKKYLVSMSSYVSIRIVRSTRIHLYSGVYTYA